MAEIDFLIGHGYDVHRLVPSRPLVLGGVEIPHDMGLDGHSDADVLLHAIMDAVLGALALGDIGQHFPDTDVRYSGISSLTLLEQVIDMMRGGGYVLGNLDATILAQKPRLAPYIPTMRCRIATVFATDKENVSIKATTEEHLGFTGRCEGIAAHAVCILKRQ